MNQIIKLVARYQIELSDELFIKIVEKFLKLINYYCNKVDLYKDDLKQELLMKLDNIAKGFKLVNISVDKTLFTEEHISMIKYKKYKNVNKVMNSNYINGFIKKYGKELFDESFLSEKKRKIFLNEYSLFCNENQLLKYINIAFKNCFLIHLNMYTKDNVLSLDEMKDEGFELIDNNQVKDKKEIMDLSILKKKEKDFIKKFIDNGKLLSERKVAKILGISQQAVNKRKKKIILKYKNILKE